MRLLKISSGLIQLQGIDEKISWFLTTHFFWPGVKNFQTGLPTMETNYKIMNKFQSSGIYQIKDFNFNLFPLFPKELANYIEQIYVSISAAKGKNLGGIIVHKDFYSDIEHIQLTLCIPLILSEIFEEYGSFTFDNIQEYLQSVVAHELRHAVDHFYSKKSKTFDKLYKPNVDYYNQETEMKSFAGDIARNLYKKYLRNPDWLTSESLVGALSGEPAFTSLKKENKKNFLLRVFNEIQRLLSEAKKK